ncbi:MAG: HAD family hydrolase [Oscillospiraceae bacterium]|nr:HAD family hydrolase [Oscillospiraceae bacterium]
MSRKLIFLDIDGTLTVPGSNEPPKSALDAIRSAQDLGHKVLLCSGRNPDMMAPVLKYGFDGYVACSGGYVAVGDEVLYDCPMTKEQQETAMRLFKENGIYRTVEAKDGSFCDEGLADFLFQQSGGNSEMLRWRKALESDLGIRPMSEYDGRPIYKVVFICSDLEQIRPAKDALEKDFYFLVQEQMGAQAFNGELVNRKFDKGTGVRIAAEKLGFDIADTIGFGDSMNDLEMIETVGTSVCMENGSEALKRMSDLVCPSVMEDGLAAGFRSLGLLKS